MPDCCDRFRNEWWRRPRLLAPAPGVREGWVRRDRGRLAGGRREACSRPDHGRLRDPV